MATIGSIIKEFRTRREMSLSDLGRAASVSKGLLSDLENNKREDLHISTLAKIAQAMSTRASVLLRALEEKQKEN